MRALALVALAVVCSCACTPSSAKAHAPAESAAPATPPGMRAQKADVSIDTPTGPARFTVELAITEPERERGLMYREHLDDDAGMLFLFERQHPLNFWMKNTRIPLDMMFIDERGTIAGIVENAEPLTLSPRRVDKPSRYVLEVNGGTCRKLGIAAGQRVHFSGVPVDLVDARVLQ